MDDCFVRSGRYSRQRVGSELSGRRYQKTEGTVKIKTNDIQEGTTYITLTVKDDTTNESATVVKKVTVVKEDELTYETMKATLVFDLSALAGEKMTFWCR